MFNGSNQMGGGSRVTPLHQNFPNIRIDPAIVLLGARRILHTYLPAHVDSDPRPASASSGSGIC